MIDISAFHMLLFTVTSWLDRREREVLAYLIEENRLLRRRVGGRRLRLTDDDRRRLAARAYRLGRQTLREIATIVTPDTLLRWHRQLIAANGPTPNGERRVAVFSRKSVDWSCGWRRRIRAGATRASRVPSRTSGTDSGRDVDARGEHVILRGVSNVLDDTARHQILALGP